MKANEYIKKYGTDCAKEILKYNQDLVDVSFFIDLKRLVESRELVESRGGLGAAKHELILLQKRLHNSFGYESIVASEKIENLKQAIADVESCMEVDQ